MSFKLERGDDLSTNEFKRPRKEVGTPPSTIDEDPLARLRKLFPDKPFAVNAPEKDKFPKETWEALHPQEKEPPRVGTGFNYLSVSNLLPETPPKPQTEETGTSLFDIGHITLYKSPEAWFKRFLNELAAEGNKKGIETLGLDSIKPKPDPETRTSLKDSDEMFPNTKRLGPDIEARWPSPKNF